jgi:hypothetical protein
MFKMMSKINFPHKKNFKVDDLHCDFCQRQGHDIGGCLARPTVPTNDERCPYLDKLILTEPIDVLIYEGLTLEEAYEKFMLLGQKLNEKNPYKDKTDNNNLLRSKIGFWKAIGADSSVISWIAYGLPFRTQTEPESFRFPNHKSYFEHKDFCTNEIVNQVRKGIFRKVPPEFAFIVNPQMVMVQGENNKERRCDDCRWINACLAYMMFTMETLGKTVPHVIKPGHKLFTIDLEKAYYKLVLNRRWHKFICFEHDGDFYCSMVLLFGLGPGPFWFTKINRPALAFFRVLLVNVVNYIDDWLFGEEHLKIASLIEFAKGVFGLLGWLLNEKCNFEPSDYLVFLGMIIDAENLEFRSPDYKILRVAALFERLIQQARQGNKVSLDDIRSVTGYCVSLSLATPPIMFWVRQLNKIAPIAMGKGFVPISNDQMDLMLEIPVVLSAHNGSPMLPSDEKADFTFMMDAGEMGGGVNLDGVPFMDFPLPADVIGRSSTFRELFVAVKAIETLSDRGDFKDMNVEFVLDSSNAVSDFKKFGSNTDELNLLTKSLWQLSTKAGIRLTLRWVSRKDNKMADEQSKMWARQWTLSNVAVNAVRSNLSSKMSISAPKFTDAIG